MAVRAYRLFSIDGDENLTLIPLCARRVLDALGLKLSLDAWQGLELEARGTLAEAGSGRVVDRSLALGVLSRLELPTAAHAVEDEPSGTVVPEAVVAALGSERPLVSAVWAALCPLERWALVKVARRGHSERLEQVYDEIVGHSRHSVHLRPDGSVRMVDVSEKTATERNATAESRISLAPTAFELLIRGNAPKGDVLSTARLAGIMAAKRTDELIPLCHSIRLSSVAVDCNLEAASCSVSIVARAKSLDRTGVEMEALVAASVAALTIYDMMKAFDRGMTIGPTRLVAKSGGNSGDFARDVSG
jgi:cyclic pyranopterin phosphate synthase